MSNSKIWPTPDQQHDEQGREDVQAHYILSPSTGLAAEPGNGFVGTALTPYGSNPSQTAASGADTLYKFGAAGNTPFNHAIMQNNTSAGIFYAFDQSTTVAGASVYTLAAGQIAVWDRAGTVLHFSSAAQQSFGGQTGITVEAFA